MEKTRNYGNVIILFLLLLALLAAPFYGTPVPAYAEGEVTVTLQVTGSGDTDLVTPTSVTVGTGTVTEDGIEVNRQTALGALVTYCQDNSIEITLSTSYGSAYVVQIGTNAADNNSWCYAYNGVSLMVGAGDQAVQEGDTVHWYNYLLGYYSLELSLDKTEIVAGDSVTATVEYTDGTGTTSPIENAEIYVSDTTDEYGSPEAGTLKGSTDTNGEYTITFDQTGTYYPYAVATEGSTQYQYPTPTVTVTDGTVTVTLQVTGSGGTNLVSATDITVGMGAVTEDGIEIDCQTALGTLITYCQDNSIEVTLSTYGTSAYVVQIGTNDADNNNWSYALNGVSPMVGAGEQAVQEGDIVHWYNYLLGYYSMELSLDKTIVVSGDSVTATVEYTDGTGTISPLENAEIYVSDTMGSYDPESDTLEGSTDVNGECTITFSQSGTYYPYAIATEGSTQYQYPTPTVTVNGTPCPWAVEVVSSSGTFGDAPYDNPEAVLGKPTTVYYDSWSEVNRLVKLVEGPYGTDEQGNEYLTTLNEGGEIVVRFDHKVEDDVNNPYGIDFLVFGNSIFQAETIDQSWVDDTTDMNTTQITGGITAEPLVISVSQDGENWYTYSSGPYGDDMFPTQAYEWDTANAQWTANEMDFTKPVDPALVDTDFTQYTAAQVIALYDGSGGGTGFDLSDSPYEWIEYVRVQGLSGYAGGEIDAFADVASTGFSDASVYFEVPETVPCNSDFTVEIKIDNVENLDACNYDISFDTSVLQLNAVDDGEINSIAIPVGGWNENPSGSGTFSIVQNIAELTGVSGSGTLAVLEFTPLGTTGDNTTITLGNYTFGTPDMQTIEVTTENAYIELSTVRGDANGDGDVNAIDITAVERQIVGLDDETPGADANLDGNVNALDITTVERIIIGLE